MLHIFIDETWARAASVIGVIISTVGFAITIFNLWRSRRAAELAADAASEARRAIMHHDVIAELSAANQKMLEIKRLQRISAWGSLPDQYSAVRQQLITIRQLHPGLQGDESRHIQDAITALSTFETTVEKAIQNKKRFPSPDRYNARVSELADYLHEMQNRLKGVTDESR